MFILTLNCGSSSAKYQVYDWDNRSVISVGIIDRIGQEQSSLTHQVPGRQNYEARQPCPDHVKAVSWIMETLTDSVHGCLADIGTIGVAGHRVVHGGETFTQSVTVDSQVLAGLEACSSLAPLHNPANITGIRAAQKVLPNIPHCAVPDTAWHQTMPQSSYLYALPYKWYQDYKIRRYGFHGTSYIYTAKRAAVLLGKDPAETNLVIAHIGNGASICAVKKGISFDTSMGFTPLEGLVMGTRSGDMDPAIITYMMRETGMDSYEMDGILNKKSGVLGISEQYIDRRDIYKNAEDGNENCNLARAIECYRIKKYIGAYSAALSRVDAIVFTAGVGEMLPACRWKVLHGLSSFGIKIDRKKNELSHTRNGETCISADDSPVKIFVIPTDEELVITEDAHALMSGTYDIHTRFRYSFQSSDYRNKAREVALKEEIAINPKLATILAQQKS